MHYTSPAHPQEKKQEYQIDYLQRLVEVKRFTLARQFVNVAFIVVGSYYIHVMQCINVLRNW